MNLEEIERSKYRRMYERPSYRERSPGHRKAPYAFEVMGMRSGESLIDFGCGMGWAADWFNRQGLYVLGIDIASNAIEKPVPYLEACLWDLPVLRPHDWGYCCDVMEHIPEEKVDDVLAGIARYSIRGAFLAISLGEDHCGEEIGETLHVTVKPKEWWHEKLTRHWDVEYGDGEHELDLTCLCRNG